MKCCNGKSVSVSYKLMFVVLDDKPPVPSAEVSRGENLPYGLNPDANGRFCYNVFRNQISESVSLTFIFGENG